MVNDAGGIKGRKINLIEKDDRYSPTVSLDSVKSLVSNDKVPLIVGINTSSALTSILTVLNQNNVLGLGGQVVPEGGVRPVQPNSSGPLQFRRHADVAVGYQMTLQKKTTLKGQKVGVFSLAGASGQEWADLIKERVQRLGGTFVGAQLLPTTSVTVLTSRCRTCWATSRTGSQFTAHRRRRCRSSTRWTSSASGSRSIGISAVMAENVYKGNSVHGEQAVQGRAWLHARRTGGGSAYSLLLGTAAKYRVSSDDVNNVPVRERVGRRPDPRPGAEETRTERTRPTRSARASRRSPTWTPAGCRRMSPTAAPPSHPQSLCSARTTGTGTRTSSSLTAPTSNGRSTSLTNTPRLAPAAGKRADPRSASEVASIVDRVVGRRGDVRCPTTHPAQFVVPVDLVGTRRSANRRRLQSLAARRSNGVDHGRIELDRVREARGLGAVGCRVVLAARTAERIETAVAALCDAGVGDVREAARRS